MSAKPLNVLFLCTGNSARSILAEVLMSDLGNPRFRGFSAGSQPKDEPHPVALSVLERQGHDITGLRSKSWDEFEAEDAPNMHFVFTVCDSAANETCPVWPGTPITAHWGLPDPAAVTGSEAEVTLAFSDTYRMLRQRIDVFLNLPHEQLDRMSLRKAVKEIGKG